jgi:hypothetical protein
MIRKALLIAAAVVMPVATVSAITLGAGVAAAKGGTPMPTTCTTTGSVAFPKPGLTYDGALTTKTTETSKSTFTGSGTYCSTKAIKLSIVSDNTKCPVGGPPEACTGDIAKDPYYYDDTAGFANSSTEADIYTALAKGIKTTDNGTKITLEQPPSQSDVTAVVDGACGSDAYGFSVTNGPVSDGGGPTLTWSNLTCLTKDSGGGTTNSFYNDLNSSAGGDESITIATATIGGASALTISS